MIDFYIFVQTKNFLKVYVMKIYFRASKWRRTQKIQKADIGDATVSLIARAGYSDVFPQPRHVYWVDLKIYII